MDEQLLRACEKLVVFADEILSQAGKLCFDIRNLNDALVMARPAISRAKKKIEGYALIQHLLEQCIEFQKEIRPLSPDHGGSDHSYRQYDEAYNEWLEALHGIVQQHFVDAGEL